MKRLIILILLISALPVFGADHYISPTGTDSGDCTGSDCRTFAYALAAARMPAGDRLILRNGTYSASAGTGYLNVQCGSGVNNGTASLPITVKAENERLAFIQGNGSTKPIWLNFCNYWVLDGLRAEGGDFQSEGGFEAGVVVLLSNSNNLTVKRGLFRYNNRYINSHVMELYQTGSSLIEENEIYEHHRHGFAVFFGNSNIFRRNYVNSRGYQDIEGGYGSHQGDSGDDGITVYPGSNNIIENNISEWENRGITVLSAQSGSPEASSTGNNLYGNITMTTNQALVTGDYVGISRPINTTFRDSIAIGDRYWGMGGTGQNTQFINASNIGATIGGSAGGVGFHTYCDWACDVHFTNASTNTTDSSDTTGFNLNTPNATYSLDYGNAYGFGTPYSPSLPNANITNATTSDPQLGSCIAWIPATSPMKGAGANGGDKGANVLYKYQNGVLTANPLWNTTTNDFMGCGAIVTGINDIAGSSCSNVDIRLHIGAANGCAYPAGYGESSGSGGQWISIDDFESYTLGVDLSGGAGGSGWTGNWTQGTAAMDIVAAPWGGKALRINADADASYTRTLANLSKGLSGYSFSIDRTNPGGGFKVVLDEGTSGRCLTSIDTDGNVKIFDGTTRFNVGAYTANTKHRVVVEFDNTAQPNSCRAQLDSGVFSQWFPVVGGSYTNINRMRLESETGFDGVLLIDEISEGSASTVVSTISYTGPGGSQRWFIGETKNLTWISTEVTNVKIEVSRDLGAHYETIIASTAASAGSYAWTVTTPAQFSPADQVIIKVSDASNLAVFDTSDPVDIYGTYLKVQ